MHGSLAGRRVFSRCCYFQSYLRRNAMKVEIRSNDSQRRHGKLSLSRNGGQIEIALPTCLLSTNAGCVPHLSKETFSYIPKNLHPTGVKVPLTSVIDHKSIFSEYPGWSGELMNLSPSSIMIASVQDTLVRTKNIPHPSQNTTKAISIWGNSGRIMLTPEKHIEFVSTLKPDLFEVLADGDTSSEDVSKKRVSKSYANSLKFLEESLKLVKKYERLSSSYVIASLEGGNSAELRQKFTSELLEKLIEKDVFDRTVGFVVDGINLKTGITAEALRLVRASLEVLPQDKLRLLHGSHSPADVIKLFECGIDVFDSSYPINSARKNLALAFSLPDYGELADKEKIEQTDSNGSGKVKVSLGRGVVDLSNICHRTSFEPILKDCPCYTCQRHTRAYIHHLISVKELLAPILLTLHNLHHYLRFFDSLRKSLDSGTYGKFRSHFVGRDVDRFDCVSLSE